MYVLAQDGVFLTSEILPWDRNSVLEQRIRMFEILPWDRKMYRTHAILPRLSPEGYIH